MNLKQILSSIIAVITIGAAIYAVDNHYAKASDVRDLRATTIEIQRSQLVNQLFTLQNNFPNVETRPILVKSEICRLQEEINKLDRRLEKLYKGGK